MPICIKLGFSLEGSMQDGANATKTIPSDEAAPEVRSSSSLLWTVLGWLSLVLCAASVGARFAIGPIFDPVLILAACATVLLLAIRLLASNTPSSEPVGAPAPDPLREIFDSAGPGMIALDLEGRVTYVNPSAERMLGYHADELKQEWATFELLGPGEGMRLVSELEKICGLRRPPEMTPAGRIAAYMECVRTLPPSRVPSFDVQMRRRNGELAPISLHVSALRGAEGALTGLVAVGVDQGASLRHDQAQRESQERYRDLFENSSEMIATLSPAGSFSTPNPAWKPLLRQRQPALLETGFVRRAVRRQLPR